MFAPVPWMTGTVLSQNPGILAFGGNPVAYVWVVGSGNMSPVLPD